MHPELDGGEKTKEHRWSFLSQIYVSMCGLFTVICGIAQLASASEYSTAGIILLVVGLGMLAHKKWASYVGGVLALIIGGNYVMDLYHDSGEVMIGLIVMLGGIGMLVSGLKLR